MGAWAEAPAGEGGREGGKGGGEGGGAGGGSGGKGGGASGDCGGDDGEGNGGDGWWGRAAAKAVQMAAAMEWEGRGGVGDGVERARAGKARTKTEGAGDACGDDIYSSQKHGKGEWWVQLASGARSSYSLLYGSLWNEVVAPHPDHYVDRRMGGYKARTFA